MRLGICSINHYVVVAVSVRSFFSTRRKDAASSVRKARHEGSFEEDCVLIELANKSYVFNQEAYQSQG